MSNLTYKLAHEQFEIAKQFLDSDQFKESIKLYDNLIKDIDKAEMDDKLKIILEVSLCNRGCAKCNLALKLWEKDLYEDGMSDFHRSIEVGSPNTLGDKIRLTAHKYLEIAQNDIKKFDNGKDSTTKHSRFKSI